MARPLRLEFPGALYHITSRGNRREAIYENTEDREAFLTILGDVCALYRWRCYAYCLMGNHYHLLIETLDGNLSKGMRQLNGVYTQTFNRLHQRSGHVFQGRYKSILVEKESYLLELARYIVLNPVRATMVRSAREWRWSSYRATVGQQAVQPWHEVKGLLSIFGRRKSVAVEKYKQFVADGKNQPSPWQALKNQVYLGDDQFVEDMQDRIADEENLAEVPSAQRRSRPQPLEDYKTTSNSRDDAIVAAYWSGGYSMKEIGEHYGLHYSRVSRIVKKARDKT